MNILETYTNEQLQEELEKRRDEKEKKENTPQLLPDYRIILAFPKIKEFLQDNIESIATTGYPFNNFKYFCFEHLIETFYSEYIWPWYNKYCKGE